MKKAFFQAHYSNYTKGRAKKIKYITFHHTAANNSTLRFLYRNPARNGSATYFVGRGYVEQYIKESDTPWTNGNYASNQESITIETRGDWRFGYNDALTLKTLKELVADIRTRNPGIGYTIHRNVSNKATACPGDLPVEQVWRGSNTMTTRDQVKAIYKAVLHRTADAGGLKNYTGRDANLIIKEMMSSNEFKAQQARVRGMISQINSLKLALDKKQPPKTIIKEIEKIVEVEVIVTKDRPLTWDKVASWIVSRLNKLREK